MIARAHRPSAGLAAVLAAACVLLAADARPVARADAVYDLLLRNGHLIDPVAGRDGRTDIAITGTRIVRIGGDLRAHQAKRTVDLDGYYVTPGLIDLHAYVNGQAVFRQGDPRTHWRNVNPDHNALRHGVTTVVDGGSTGWRNFESFRKLVVEESRVRVLAFLNIVGSGMMEGQERADPSDVRAEPTIELARRHADRIVGIRTPHLPGAGREGLDQAFRAAGAINGVALIEHLEADGMDYGELVLQRARPGDLVTHTFGLGTPLLDGTGRVNDVMGKARARGVLFDLGHGTQGFWFRLAVPAVRAGFVPDTLSTAMDKTSLLLPRAEMMTTLSKFLNMGVSLQELVDRTTVRPARALKRPELGTLKEGGPADIAVLDVQEGQFGFLDAGHARMRGDRRVRAILTIREGRVVWDSEGLSRTDWSHAGPYSNYR